MNDGPGYTHISHVRLSNQTISLSTPAPAVMSMSGRILNKYSSVETRIPHFDIKIGLWIMDPPL